MRSINFGMAAAMVLLAWGAYAQNEALKNRDFKDGLKYWLPDSRLALPISKTGFAVETADGVPCLAAAGSADKNRKSFQLVQHIALPVSEILGKKVIFSADINAEKISGTFLFMIREGGIKGSIRYRKITLDKWTEPGWRKYTAEFVVFKPTRYLQVYFQTHYLKPEDKILVKNVSVILSDRSS